MRHKLDFCVSIESMSFLLLENIWRNCRKEFVSISADYLGYTGKMSGRGESACMSIANLELNELESEMLVSLLLLSKVKVKAYLIYSTVGSLPFKK